MSEIIIKNGIRHEKSLLYTPLIIAAFLLTFSMLIILYNLKDFTILNLLLFIIFVLLLLIIGLIPYFYLYNNHRKLSFDHGIILNNDIESELKIHFNSKIYILDDVLKIHYVKDFSLALPIYPDFNYLNIFFKDGSNVIISSIMFKELLTIFKLFDGKKIKAINRSPCFINLVKDDKAKNIALSIPEIKFSVPNSNLE